MAVIPRNKLQTMPLGDLYRVEKITPSVTKRILMLEDFRSHAPDYCRTHCMLPEGDQCGDKVLRHNRGADVLIVLPRMSSDSQSKYGKTNYGWAEDSLHSKILSYLIDKYLSDLNVEVTYALKCRPKNPKVTTTTIKRCIPYLRAEIDSMMPRIVLAMGKETTQALGIAKPKRGLVEPFNTYYGPVPILTSLHPKITCMIRQNSSGQFWGTDYLTILEHDFKKAGDIARGKVKLRPLDDAIQEFKENKLYVTKSIDEILQLERDLSRLPPNSILAWDTETTSLDPWYEDARLLCIQFCFKHHTHGVISVVVPLWHRNNDHYNPDEAWPIIARILLDPKTVKIGHNMAFDIMYLRVVYGINPVNVQFDTMLLLHSINSGLQGFYDLKTSMADHLFELQLAGYEDKLDIKELKKRLGVGLTEDEESEDENEDISLTL